jgi:hypothetical protein
MEAAKVENAAGQVETKGPTSFFHGKEEKDYQGEWRGVSLSFGKGMSFRSGRTQ